MSECFDKKGIPIKPLDVLKVFHFVGSRRKKHYMYKQAVEYKGGRLYINHLTKPQETYSVKANDEILEAYEIVQGYAECVISFEDRPRKQLKEKGS